MYKSYSKFRQQFKESYTIDLGAGLRQGDNRKRKVSGKRKNKRSQADFQANTQNAEISIEANIYKNKERLDKAKKALERQNQNRIKLEEKIADAWSADFLERHEIWLEECKKKISDIKVSVEKVES